ncbi:MAG: SpoIID/LytB domain-containing protein [Veillonellales bacterium]
MKQKSIFFLLPFLLTFFLLFLLTPVSAAKGIIEQQSSFSAEPAIRVGIWSNQPNIIISSDADYAILNAGSKEIIKEFTAKEKVNVAIREDGIAINGVVEPSKNITVRLKNQDGEHFVEVNKRRYRGQITIHQTQGKNGLTVVNTLPLEQYLYGVIAREVSPEWPLEAVKAQAVAARTYALYNLGKHQADGYDVCSTTDCQLYGGLESEASGAIQAVNDTYGQAVLYQGKLIAAYFHSNSGGYTEDSENVWGTYQPYLRGVVDEDQNTPHFKWTKQFTPTEFEGIMRRYGYSIGSLQAFQLSKLTSPPVSAFDRGISGRIKTVRIMGTAGMVEISGNKLRSILTLDSTLFDISIVTPVPKAIEVQITDNTGDHEKKKIEVNVPASQEKEFLNDKDTVHRLTGRPGETIVFNGFGWGHGLGLSQWGAKVMADRAPKGDTTYFKEILRHYYQGVDIIKIY